MDVAGRPDEHQDANRAEDPDRHVDVEDPAPVVVLRQPAAEHRPHDRTHDRAGAEHRHGMPVTLRRIDLQQCRLRQRDQSGAGEALQGTEQDQLVQGRRGAAQGRGDRKAGHRGEENVFDAKSAGEPAGQRHHDRGAHNVGGQRPGDLILRGREAPLHMRQRDIEDRVVEPLHDVRQHDRDRDHAAVGDRRVCRLPPHRRGSPLIVENRGLFANAQAASTCATVGASPATVVRRMSRISLSSKRRTRCIICRLSHMTRSYCRQRWT